MIIEEIREEIKKILEYKEKENTIYQSISKGTSNREVCSYECLIKKSEKSQMNSLMIHLKVLEEQK
jgi:hypothetical protein